LSEPFSNATTLDDVDQAIRRVDARELFAFRVVNEDLSVRNIDAGIGTDGNALTAALGQGPQVAQNSARSSGYEVGAALPHLIPQVQASSQPMETKP